MRRRSVQWSGASTVAAQGEMPDHAACRVDPGFGAYIKRERKDLEAASIQGSKEIVDILAAQGVFDRIAFFASGAPLQNPGLTAGDYGAIAEISNEDFSRGGDRDFSGGNPVLPAAWRGRGKRSTTAGRSAHGSPDTPRSLRVH